MRLTSMIASHPTIAGDVVSGLEGYWGLVDNGSSLVMDDIAVVDATIMTAGAMDRMCSENPS